MCLLGGIHSLGSVLLLSHFQSRSCLLARIFFLHSVSLLSRFHSFFLKQYSAGAFSGGFIFVSVLGANDSWIAFAPVADFTRDYFGLSSSTPVNWLSTVVLFVYCVLSPVTAYVYHHHGVRLGVRNPSPFSSPSIFVRVALLFNTRPTITDGSLLLGLF